MIMFLLGMLTMYMITGIILVIEGFSADWLQWLFGWWFALLIILFGIIRKKIRKRGK